MPTMGLGLQKHLMTKFLERRGIDPQTVDLDALLDASLSFKENRANLAAHLQLPGDWQKWEAEDRADEAAPPAQVQPTGFGAFVPPPKPVHDPSERAAYAGLSPDVAAESLAKTMAERRSIRAVTLRQKTIILRAILKDLAQRGLDLATLTPPDVALYREYLKDRVTRGDLATSSASHRAKVHNSTMRLVFDDETLTMRGFAEHPRLVDHLTEAQFSMLLTVIHDYPAFNDHDVLLMIAYLHLEWSIGARIGSLAPGRLEVGDFDFEVGVVHLRYMKNKASHTAILSDTAVREAKEWIDTIKGDPAWKGDATPFFIHSDGSLVQPAWFNKHLKALGKLAGIQQKLTTHVLRKSVGTILAKVNPKFAEQQLGTSSRVFHEHSNQMSLQDRQDLRHLLPRTGRE
ncbi:MAG: tyrosine-type recombinase/integrase [bacterium]